MDYYLVTILSFIVGCISTVFFISKRRELKLKEEALMDEQNERSTRWLRKKVDPDNSNLETIFLKYLDKKQDGYYENDQVFITFRKSDMFPRGVKKQAPRPSSLDFAVEQADDYKRRGKNINKTDISDEKEPEVLEIDHNIMRLHPFKLTDLLSRGEATVYSKVGGIYVDRILKKDDDERTFFYLPDGTYFFHIQHTSVCFRNTIDDDDEVDILESINQQTARC